MSKLFAVAALALFVMQKYVTAAPSVTENTRTTRQAMSLVQNLLQQKNSGELSRTLKGPLAELSLLVDKGRALQLRLDRIANQMTPTNDILLLAAKEDYASLKEEFDTLATHWNKRALLPPGHSAWELVKIQGQMSPKAAESVEKVLNSLPPASLGRAPAPRAELEKAKLYFLAVNAHLQNKILLYHRSLEEELQLSLQEKSSSAMDAKATVKKMLSRHTESSLPWTVLAFQAGACQLAKEWLTRDIGRLEALAKISPKEQRKSVSTALQPELSWRQNLLKNQNCQTEKDLSKIENSLKASFQKQTSSCSLQSLQADYELWRQWRRDSIGIKEQAFIMASAENLWWQVASKISLCAKEIQ